MNFPGPAEFTFLLFLALFFSWIKAGGAVLAALLIRPIWWSMAVAAVAGIVDTAVDMGPKLFFSGLTVPSEWPLLLIPVAGALIWWALARGVLALFRRIMPRFAS